MSVPPASVLLRAAQVSIAEDRPIYLDYYQDSLDKKCCIGVRENEKFLVKSDSEYTSTVQSVFKCESCYIVMTENSLYIVDAGVPIKKILAQPKTETA
jgi:hypothetical protein